MPKTQTAGRAAAAPTPTRPLDFQALLAGLASQAEKTEIESLPAHEEGSLFDVKTPEEAIERIHRVGVLVQAAIKFTPQMHPDPATPYIQTGLTVARMTYLT